METSAVLLVVILFLGATAICVALFQRLGFGSVLGFIVAGILIGPHTPGPIASHNVSELQAVAELGVVLFMFTVGLEMRPQKIWSMRRLLLGLGSAQLLVTGAVIALYCGLFAGEPWPLAVILGLGLAMSSTAIVMTTLQERGLLASQHGNTSFAILMAQDLWIVPVLALVPILAQTTAAAPEIPLWRKALLAVGSIAGIVVVGRYLLPSALAETARRRQMEAFGILLLLAVVGAAWAVEQAGISMTLGAFLMGVLLSASDYRYQIEASIEPYKHFLMGLFFIAVGMSIDLAALLTSWSDLVVHVPVVISLKLAVLLALALAFGVRRPAAIRTAFYLSQSGEFAFVLFGAAAAVGLVGAYTHTLATLVVAVSMILTPLLVKAGDRLAHRARGAVPADDALAEDLDRHVVVVGCDEVGMLICLMLEKAKVPYVAFDRDVGAVEQGKRWGKNVHYGDMFSPVTQQAAALGRALAVFVGTSDRHLSKGLAVTLQRLYPALAVFVRVRTLGDQAELIAKGVHFAGAGYVESALLRGSALLKQVGVPQSDVDELIDSFRHDNYALIQTAEAEALSPERG